MEKILELFIPRITTCLGTVRTSMKSVFYYIKWVSLISNNEQHYSILNERSPHCLPYKNLISLQRRVDTNTFSDTQVVPFHFFPCLKHLAQSKKSFWKLKLDLTPHIHTIEIQTNHNDRNFCYKTTYVNIKGYFDCRSKTIL